MNYGSIGSYPHEETSRSASAEIDDIDDDDDEQYHDAQQQHHHHQYHHDAQSMGGSSVASSVRDLIVDRALTHSGRPVSVRNFGGTSTITRSSITLVKNIVGAGVLALPSGVSTFATSPSAVIPSSIWLVVMGIVFGYEFQLIGKVCDMTVSSTFREAWDDTVGRNIDNDDRDNIDDEVHPPSSSLPSSLVSRHAGTVVSWVNMLKPALANLAYSMILADTFRSLFATIGWDVTRTGCLLLVTLMGILPLCLLKNLDALAPFSMLGTVSILLITVCMGIRCYDGTYDPIDGIYIDSLPEKYRPIFGTYNGYWTVSVLVYVAMIFEAYIAHYNAPRFYTELHDATIRRFRIVVGNGFGLSTILYILIMSFGYLTFGGNCDGYILNNYSDNDSLMTVSRFVISFSILFTYPVTFMVRVSVLVSAFCFCC